MLIKVCGMKDAANIALLSELKPDFMGFIFYKKSPRYAFNSLSPLVVKNLPKSIIKTGVFVNAPEQEILDIASTYQLDAIQLHGQEPASMAGSLKTRGFKVLKAFHLRNTGDLNNLINYEDVCDYFLFDTPSTSHGGTGKKFNWQLLENYQGTTPYFISGGIGPEDAQTIKNLSMSMLAGIDINSRFENKPGLKNVDTIKDFLKKLNLTK